MSSLTFGGKARSATMTAVITRADGTVENIGAIAYYHRNPIKHWLVNAYIAVKRRLHG